ncbi:MAG: lysine--tRNA ligase, partial [Alphaproteobacteria bacterium]
AFSDDMDGLRKVPDNVPNKEMLAGHLGIPLSRIPDPFGTHDSFGAHNNARLCAFLDRFGFDYDFRSSTQMYADGRFDDALRLMLVHYDKVMAAILPTLGTERQQTYSPFLPICPKTGIVLQVPVLERNVDAGTIVYEDPQDGTQVEVPVTGGHCKLQWKADWAMRWFALDVDYEMSGKDLIDSVRLSARICRILGKSPPQDFTYELFLDENGEKISKSKGNGLSLEDWLIYGPAESVSLYMFQKPRTAKRLYFDVIPKAVDEYLTFAAKYPELPLDKAIESPVWHVHSGPPPPVAIPVSFALLLNLAGACNTEDKAVLMGFIDRHAPGASVTDNALLDRLVEHAIAYYRDFVKPTKQYRQPTAQERAALEDLAGILAGLAPDSDASAIQDEVYAVGKRHDFENLRDWFRALYEVLFGQSQGPRFGSFVALYGLPECVTMIENALANSLQSADGAAASH